jgi:hypothetical protein
MKKLSVMFVSLILLVGTIGMGSVLGCCVEQFYVTNNTVHVSEFITVISVSYSGQECIQPSAIEVLNEDDSVSDKAVLVNSKCDGRTLTATYRAVKQGNVKFKYAGCTQQLVTILPKPHPMFSFMKILGFGKSD